MADRLTAVPDHITAGTSVELTLTYADYPADDGWGLALHFHGKNDVTVSGGEVVAVGKAFEVTIPITKTQTLGTLAPPEGLIHNWSARVTKGSTAKIADSGVTTIEPDPLTAGSGSMQSFAERMVALLRSAISGQITSAGFMKQYAMTNRSVVYEDREAMNRELAYWEAQVEAEKFPGQWGPQVLAHMVPPS